MARAFDFSLQSQDMRRVSAGLKAAADRNLRKNVNEAIMQAAEPVLNEVRAKAREILPRKGGLNEWVADATYKAVFRGGANAGVTLRGTSKGHDLRSIDRGFVRHPVYGAWRKGVNTEPVRPGFFTDTVREKATGPMVKNVLGAVRQTFDEAQRGG